MSPIIFKIVDCKFTKTEFVYKCFSRILATNSAGYFA